MVDLSDTFTREVELFNTTLQIHQAIVGDVGCVVWDAAIVLAKYLEKTRRSDVKGKIIVELGAGTGIVGLCCSLAGFTLLEGSSTYIKLKWVAQVEIANGITDAAALAEYSTKKADVVCTDLEELLPLIELNKKTNESSLKGKFDVLKLKWGEKAVPPLPFADYVIMSDVIYYPESLEPLVKTICTLADQKTEVILSYEERFDGNKPFLEKRFFELTEEYFVRKEIPPEEQDSTFQSSDIHIISMRRKGCQ